MTMNRGRQAWRRGLAGALLVVGALAAAGGGLALGRSLRVETAELRDPPPHIFISGPRYDEGPRQAET